MLVYQHNNHTRTELLLQYVIVHRDNNILIADNTNSGISPRPLWNIDDVDKYEIIVETCYE